MSFKSNAITMLTGTVLAQALPLLASPFLTRIYSPEEFGIQALFMGITTSIAVLATCRLDLAIVLPDNDVDTASLAGFVFCTTIATAIFSSLAVPLVGLFTTRSLPLSWIILIPLMICAIAVYQLSIGFVTRERRFRKVAEASVSNQTAYIASAIILGLGGALSQTLILSKIVGQVIGTSLLGRSSAASLTLSLLSFSWKRSKSTAYRYRQFLIFNTPYSLIGSIARDSPIYIFWSLAEVGAVGFFGLARTMMMAPTLVISNAFSQVFFREAVALKGTRQLEQLTLWLLQFGLTVLAPIFAFFSVWGDHVFSVFFGEKWRVAGVFAMILAPPAWMSVQTGWPERLFEVNGRQGVSFSVQIISDVFVACALCLTYILTKNINAALCVFAFCVIVYHHIYLISIFRVSDFNNRGLIRVLGEGWSVFILCFTVFLFLRIQAVTFGNVSWMASLVLTLAISLLIAWFLSSRRISSNSTKGEMR